MKTIASLLLLASLTCGQAIHPGGNWFPALPAGPLQPPPGLLPSATVPCFALWKNNSFSPPRLNVKLRWNINWSMSNSYQIPDPTLAPSTEVWIVVSDPVNPPTYTPFGAAYGFFAPAMFVLGPSAWVPDPFAWGWLIAMPAGIHPYLEWPVPCGCSVRLQAFVVHRYGSPDMGYFSWDLAIAL